MDKQKVEHLASILSHYLNLAYREATGQDLSWDSKNEIEDAVKQALES